MKRVLNDLTPLPGNDLFITQYWFDKQTDPPLHFHEDYMLSLTLNVKGTRVTGQSVDNFTEKDLIIIFPRVPHCYKRDEAFAETNCEAVAVQFSRDMPNWQIFETESMLPIRKMLSQPVAGLWFAESVVDRVRDRLLQLPGLRGFASASLFLNILNDLATAGPDETGPIGAPYYEMQPDGNARINKIVQFVEGNYQRKISLEDIGEEVGMSATSVCRFFKKYTHQNLWNYLNGFRHRARRTDDRRDRRPDRRDRYALRVLQHLEFQPRLPRTHRLPAGRLPAQVRVDSHFARRETGRGDRPQAG